MLRRQRESQLQPFRSAQRCGKGKLCLNGRVYCGRGAGSRLRAERRLRQASVARRVLWHHHDVEDEMFRVLDGNLTMRLRDHEVGLKQGDLPVEPGTTLSTSNAKWDLTVEKLERLS